MILETSFVTFECSESREENEDKCPDAASTQGGKEANDVSTTAIVNQLSSLPGTKVMIVPSPNQLMPSQKIARGTDRNSTMSLRRIVGSLGMLVLVVLISSRSRVTRDRLTNKLKPVCVL
jgi:hypothetical protein